MCNSLRPEFSLEVCVWCLEGDVYTEKPDVTHVLTLFPHEINFWPVAVSDFSIGRSGGN